MNNEAVKSYFVYKKYIKNEIKLRYKIITNNMKMLDYLNEIVNSQSYKTYPELGKEIDRQNTDLVKETINKHIKEINKKTHIYFY